MMKSDETSPEGRQDEGRVWRRGDRAGLAAASAELSRALTDGPPIQHPLVLAVRDGLERLAAALEQRTGKRQTATVELSREQWQLLVKVLEEQAELEQGARTEAEDKLLSLVRDDAEVPDGWAPCDARTPGKYGEVTLAEGRSS